MRGIVRSIAACTLTTTLGLGGCATLPDMLGDTFTTPGDNPNMPVGASINMQRVRGLDASVEPLRTEPGNVWPKEIEKVPTLQELEKQTNQGSPAAPPPDMSPFIPGHTQPRPSTTPAPGSSTPPGAPVAGDVPGVFGGQASSRAPASPGKARGPATVATPDGPAPVTTDNGNYKTVKTPQGNAILVPNGNGTSTLIKPDGTVETVPAPK